MLNLCIQIYDYDIYIYNTTETRNGHEIIR